MPQITEAICTGNRRYLLAPFLKPVGIVVHTIGVTQPLAEALRRSWQEDRSAYVVHYVVDDQNILHTFPEDKQCWHVGSPGNAKWLSVEMCETNHIAARNPKIGTGGGFTIKDLGAALAYEEAVYQNTVWLCALKCAEYGWDPFTAVWTHYEVTRQRLSNTDHIDPQHLWDGLGTGKNLLQLRRDVAAAMGLLSADTSAPEAAPETEQIYRIRKSWEDAAGQIGAYRNLDNAKKACPDGYAVFDAAGKRVYPFKPYLVRITAQSGLNVRKGPGTNYPVVMSLAYGGAYTITEELNGWGLLKSGAGWIALRYTETIK